MSAELNDLFVRTWLLSTLGNEEALSFYHGHRDKIDTMTNVVHDLVKANVGYGYRKSLLHFKHTYCKDQLLAWIEGEEPVTKPQEPMPRIEGNWIDPSTVDFGTLKG